MKGEWCPYSNKPVFCQEESGCLNCEVYYLTMYIPHDGRTVEEIEKANNKEVNHVPG